MHRNTHYYSDIIRTIKIITFFSNHKAPHYIRCATFRAKAQRLHCQHIKLTAIFHYKSHCERQLYIPKLLWTRFSPTMPHNVAWTSQLYHSSSAHGPKPDLAILCSPVRMLAGCGDEPAWGFTGCLCRACICMAANRAVAGAGTKGGGGGFY